MKDQVGASRPSSCGDRIPNAQHALRRRVVIGHPPEKGRRRITGNPASAERLRLPPTQFDPFDDIPRVGVVPEFE